MTGVYIGKRHIWRMNNQYGWYYHVSTINEQPENNDSFFVADQEGQFRWNGNCL